MNRIEVKRGTTIISVPEDDFGWYEDRGYKKVGAAGSRARKATAKTASKATAED